MLSNSLHDETRTLLVQHSNIYASTKRNILLSSFFLSLQGFTYFRQALNQDHPEAGIPDRPSLKEAHRLAQLNPNEVLQVNKSFAHVQIFANEEIDIEGMTSTSS